jgi:phosphoenolpyruvate carboxylase
VETDEALRADIRLVTTLLGETLVRHEGQQLLDLVELVRNEAKQGELSELPELRALDLATTVRLVRAFTSYFHLANVTEQVHRGRGLLQQRQVKARTSRTVVARSSARSGASRQPGSTGRRWPATPAASRSGRS